MVEKFLLVLAAFACALLPQFHEMYYATYHRFVESPAAAIIGGIAASLILIAPALIAAMFTRTQFLTRLLAGVTILYSLDRLIESLAPGLFRIGGVEVVFVLIGAALLVLSLRYLSSSGWERLARMVLAPALALALVMPVSAWFKAASSSTLQPTLSATRILEQAPEAVAILIMDEATVGLLPELQAVVSPAQGQAVHSATTEPAGWSTIFAIPSMLTGSRHDGVVPCGTTQLCGGVSFNMKNLRASRPDIDVIGSYHPYCEMHGLRSCWTAQVTNSDSPSTNRDLWKAIGRRLPFLGGFFDVELDEVTAMRYVRDGVARHVFEAPFWRLGGTLYVHHLLPHPTTWPIWGKNVHNLSKEYKANMHDAARFVGLVNERLKAAFGLDYVLIVTTDHSLRTLWWCAQPFFRTPDCLSENPPNSSQVPFFVLAPESVKVTLPATNVGIFTPLSDRQK